jgi:hypothetical protein
MMIVQGSPEWLAQRCGMVTASRFRDVMNFTAKGAPGSKRVDYMANLVTERLTDKPVDSFVSFDMKVGMEREPDAANLFMAKTGIVLDECSFVPIIGLRAGASPDRLIGSNGLMEIKGPKANTHAGYFSLADGEAPEEYVPQIQGQLWATFRKWAYFVSYCPDFPEDMQLIVRLIKRDDAYIETLRGHVTAFDKEVQRTVDDLKARHGTFTFPAMPQ